MDDDLGFWVGAGTGSLLTLIVVLTFLLVTS